MPWAALDPTSFTDLLRRVRPEGLPSPSGELPATTPKAPGIPHATTILAIRYADGVIVAGDRRATEGYTIAHRSIEKVFPTDDASAVAIAGAAGPAIEMVRIFQTELEHYEKMEGEPLTLEGKANKLGQMIRANLPAAMQGMVVLPIFAGYDNRRDLGRIFKYDVTGGRYEESDHYSTGSGGREARSTIKKRYKRGLSRDEAVQIALEALFDASEEDAGTGGPDVLRKIYPNIASISKGGFEVVPDDEIAALFASLLEQRTSEGGFLSEEHTVEG
ncbi:MAG TPA: proteasome subunit beta [Actinomycetota bacterium]